MKSIRSTVQFFNCTPFPWWRHQMETFSVSLAIFAANSPVNGEFPAQRPVTRSLIRAWINGSVNNREAGDLRRHRAHYNVIVMNCLVITRFDCCWLAWDKGLTIDSYSLSLGHLIKSYSRYNTALHIVFNDQMILVSTLYFKRFLIWLSCWKGN